MPQSDINGMPGTLLTSLETARVKEIIEDKSFGETRVLVDALQLKDVNNAPMPEAEQGLLKLTRYDLKVFFDDYGDGTSKTKGGREGDDDDLERDKEEVRQRLRLRLGLPAVSPMRKAETVAENRLRRTSFHRTILKY